MVVEFNHLLPTMPELGMGLPNDYIEKIVARASKATGRIEFTCDTVLCRLRHAGNPNRSTQTERWYQTASYWREVRPSFKLT